ncbi:MAG: iron chelate uptake ABC transporter family permease subunit [Pseudomonadota bacterium]|nr:iron chelate uptake ABC transporter family permease subunit [Pseudomonadota bacterium]
MTSFPLLAQPLTVGAVTLANRMVMGSMHTNLEGNPDHFDQLGRFYAARAAGGAGLIVTGGFAPNAAGRLKDHPCVMASAADAAHHRRITGPVRAAGGRIPLQILHAGRYGYHGETVAPSPIKSPINRDTPAEMTAAMIAETIADFARAAELALDAGYDGVEIMGSEGYLMSQFLAARTNHRDDDWGGDFTRRLRFPVAVTEAVRAAMGTAGVLTFRMSALDLIEGGMDDDEILALARALEAAGADCLSSGIGWHESQVPTISGTVPPAAFTGATQAIRAAVSLPVVASNRINLPETAEAVLAAGQADLISMARPFLADADFVNKAVAGASDRITVCVACNQACLDHYFTDKIVTCLVNPKAAREAEFAGGPAPVTKRVAVVGAGVAGIVCALAAAGRGHAVTLFDRADAIGGQFRLAARIPGKADFGRAIAGFAAQLAAAGVALRLGERVDASRLTAAGFGAALALLLGVSLPWLPWLTVPVAAFAGTALAALLVYVLSRLRAITAETMVLAGIATLFLFQSAQSLVQYLAAPEVLRAIVFWLFGALLKASWDNLPISAGILALGVAALAPVVWQLTALRLGDARAAALGVDVRRPRLRVFAIVALLTAGAVSFVGTIGFIGLVAPQIARMLVGDEQRFLLPMAGLTGAGLLTGASILSKVLAPGLVIPIGIVTAVIGVPFLLALIVRRGRRCW